MARFTYFELLDIRDDRTKHKLNKHEVRALVEDLLDAYALLDKQQEEYNLKTGKLELIGEEDKNG